MKLIPIPLSVIILILLSSFFITSLASFAQPPYPNESMEIPSDNIENNTVFAVKIYQHQGDLKPLFRRWYDMGINTVFVAPALDERQGFKELAKQFSIKRFLIVPTYFQPEILEKKPKWYSLTNKGQPSSQEWVKFVSPANQTFIDTHLHKIKKLITEHQPDGLSIDFIRHFTYWEKIYPETNVKDIQYGSFDQLSLKNFTVKSAINLPNKLTKASDIENWLLSNHRQAWLQWKTTIITKMASSIISMAKTVNPDLLINMHIVPWRVQDYDNGLIAIIGQDIKKLAKFSDYLQPMTYAHMLKRQPHWIHSVVSDMSIVIEGSVVKREFVDKDINENKASILPSIQVNKAYFDHELTLAEFDKSLDNALLPPSAGVVLWSWEQLLKSPKKMQIFKEKISAYRAKKKIPRTTS